jgi:hypothetical protein
VAAKSDDGGGIETAVSRWPEPALPSSCMRRAPGLALGFGFAFGFGMA